METETRFATLRALLRRQCGLVTWAQLLAIGFAESTLTRWIRLGRLERVLPRVYAYGYRPQSREGNLWVAVLYAGPGAMLSHVTAAWWHGLLDHPPVGLVEVTTTRDVNSVAGVSVFGRRSCTRMFQAGLPVTTIPRTLLDLAATAEARLLRRSLARLDFQHALNVTHLLEICSRGQPGSAGLRAALGAHEPSLARTNSRLEEDFLAFCEEWRIPMPCVNVRVHGILVDAYWPRQRLVVELDGHANHSTVGQLRRDKRSELTLRERGLEVVRYDWALIHDEPARIHADLMAQLERAR